MRNMIIRKLIISSITLFTLLVLYLFPVKDEIAKEVIYNDVSYNNVYLLYDDFLVQEQVLSNQSNIEEKIKEIVESITVDGKKKEYINDTYVGVLPKNTKLLSIDLKDSILKLDFSDELLTIDADNEEKMVEALVYSLTELDEVKGIMIFIRGNKLDQLPHSKKFLPNIITRDFGINKVYNIISLNNISNNTLYYYINIDDSNKLVPVSLYSNDDINKVEVIINELKSAPIYQSNLMSFLNENAKLLDYELLENKIKLEFDNDIMESFFDDKVIEEVKYAISLSLKDSLGIEEVSFFVNDVEI